MPRRKQSPGGPQALFYVFISRYASDEVKQRLTIPGEVFTSADQVRTEMVFLGSSETKCGAAFYRACKAAQRDPLAFEVVVWRGQETIVHVQVKHWL
jgi:hypothetical protein